MCQVEDLSLDTDGMDMSGQEAERKTAESKEGSALFRVRKSLLLPACPTTKSNFRKQNLSRGLSTTRTSSCTQVRMTLAVAFGRASPTSKNESSIETMTSRSDSANAHGSDSELSGRVNKENGKCRRTEGPRQRGSSSDNRFYGSLVDQGPSDGCGRNRRWLRMWKAFRRKRVEGVLISNGSVYSL